MRRLLLSMPVLLLALWTGTACAGTAPQAAAPATTPTAFTDAQRAEIENIIHEYLTKKKPEAIAEGLQTLQAREQSAEEERTKGKIAEWKDKLYNDPATPVGGNPKGDVTIVEFFDYRCGYCKHAEDSVEKILKEDKKVRLVYKAFPILGADSEEAVKAALASVKQNKFDVFHNALMKKKDNLSADSVYKTAKDVGLDVTKLKKDMGEKAVSDAISDNLKLGQAIGVRGTPMFIINDQIFPGALQYEQMKEAVETARAAGKK